MPIGSQRFAAQELIPTLWLSEAGVKVQRYFFKSQRQHIFRAHSRVPLEKLAKQLISAFLLRAAGGRVWCKSPWGQCVSPVQFSAFGLGAVGMSGV